MSEEILVSREGAVCRIQINRPAVKNAITMNCYQLMADAINEADSDASVRVLLLSGVDGNFTSGNDLSDFASGEMELDENSSASQYMEALMQCSKPVIAAVDGVAVGIGVTTLLHCDLVYADASAKLAMPFNSLGLCGEFGSTYLLPRMMGRAQAMELMLFGEVFDGAKAKALGIVVDVVDDVQTHALERAQTLAKQPPISTQVNKHLMTSSGQQDLRPIIKNESQRFAEGLQGAEFKEAVTAFLEKRAPDFS